MSLSSSDISFIAYLSQVHYTFTKISFFGVVNLGLVGNFLNILTFIVKRRKFAKCTMGFYNLLMSVCNVLALICAYLYFFPLAYGQNLVLMSDFVCVAISYATRVFFQMSSWISVMITLDRTICVTFPMKFRFITDKRTLTWIALSILGVITLLNAPNLWLRVQTQTLKNPITNKTSLNVQCTTSANIVSFKDLIGTIVRFCIPLVLELLFNTVLIYKLIKQRKQVCVSRDMKREYRFAFNIVVLNVLFFITETPNFILTIYMSVMGYSQPNVVITRNVAIANLAYALSISLMSYRCVCLLYVNLLVNKLFRSQFFDMFAMTWSFVSKRIFKKNI